MKNIAGKPIPNNDYQTMGELSNAKIETKFSDESCGGEVDTHITGDMNGWKFERAWYQWGATSDKGIVLDIANKMNEEWAETIRVVGCSGGTDPKGWLNDHGCIDSYHIDTQEGLNHFAGVLERLGNN